MFQGKQHIVNPSKGTILRFSKALEIQPRKGVISALIFHDIQ